MDSHLSICRACQGDCLDACFNHAIAAVQGGICISEACCAGCGACVAVCDLGHIRLEHGVAKLVFPAPSRGEHDPRICPTV